MKSKCLSGLSMRNFVFWALLPLLLLPAFTAAAVAADGLALKTEAFQDVMVTGKDGKPEKHRQIVTSAVPGTEIIYIITYRNTGAKPAEKVVVNNKVPAGLAFMPGSAQGAGARAEVSVDGGRVYGALETLTVTGADGLQVAAQGPDVTHVRWTVAAPVPPGRDGNVTYRAVLK